MKRFQVNTTIQGKPVNLTVETMGESTDSEYSFFKVRKDKNWLAVIKMDGECNLVKQGKKLFNEEDIKSLCKEIFMYLKRDEPDLTVIYL
jgi:hypothetical protein